MRDDECVLFLQWALPRLDLAWSGFRKVRGQVCKRVKRRMRGLGVARFSDYRARLDADPQEWRFLDGLCRITISRFYRDRRTFSLLRHEILPEIALRAAAQKRQARLWSAGCASGEEPYTLKLLWDLEVRPRFREAGIDIVATDMDETLLDRARRACYATASLHELPSELRTLAFTGGEGCWRLRPEHRQGVVFLRQDIRREAPPSRFDLVLCRNLAFTYFTPALQETVLKRIAVSLELGGFLVIGSHEQLLGSMTRWRRFRGNRTIFSLVSNEESLLAWDLDA